MKESGRVSPAPRPALSKLCIIITSERRHRNAMLTRPQLGALVGPVAGCFVGAGLALALKSARRSRRLLVAAAPLRPKLTLYGSAMFRPLRNVWMLEEMGIPYEHVPARPRSKEAGAVNPFAKIPTLVDGAMVMYESVAINTHLGDRYRDCLLYTSPSPRDS